MRKMKKIFAVLLTLAMVLGMSMTTMAAADDAVITINNAGTGATFEYMQLIKPDTSTETGWAFCDNVYDVYKEGFATGDPATYPTEQTIIKMLINKEVPNTYEGIAAATSGQIATALDAINNSDSLTKSPATSNEIVVGKTNDSTKAGVYFVMGTEDGYIYLPMAAYIKFGEYTNGTPGELVSTELNAKKTPLNIEKDSSEADGVVAIDKEVTYRVNTTVPYINENVSNVTYTITDTIKGAKYLVNADNKVEVFVKVGDEEAESHLVDVTTVDETTHNYTFTIDLSDIAADRSNANKTLVLTYKAIAKSEIIENTVVPNDGEHTFTPDTETLYTGKITMTKYGENNEKLAGAGFVVYRTSDNKYALVQKDTTKTSNEYVVTGWTTSEEEAKAVLIETDSNGEAVVRGLDDSDTYKFKEEKAPEGYSVNTSDETAEWDVNSTAENKTGSVSMTDTKLSALPSTGGIGTTIFTIGGCLIMIIAAALFFSSRKKSAK